MTNDANLEDKYVEKIVSMGYTEEDAKDYIESKKPKKIIIDFLHQLLVIFGFINL